MIHITMLRPDGALERKSHALPTALGMVGPFLALLSGTTIMGVYQAEIVMSAEVEAQAEAVH